MPAKMRYAQKSTSQCTRVFFSTESGGREEGEWEEPEEEGRTTGRAEKAATVPLLPATPQTWQLRASRRQTAGIPSGRGANCGLHLASESNRLLQSPLLPSSPPLFCPDALAKFVIGTECVTPCAGGGAIWYYGDLAGAFLLPSLTHGSRCHSLALSPSAEGVDSKTRLRRGPQPGWSCGKAATDPDYVPTIKRASPPSALVHGI